MMRWLIGNSYTQDALGAIGRTIKDVAIALTVMASVGFDPADNTTALIPSSLYNVDYAASLESTDLKNVRLGLAVTLFNRTAGDETTPVNDAMDAFVSRLQAAGATIVPINESIYSSSAILARYDTQRYEYKEFMDAYLSSPALGGSHPLTLNNLYMRNPTNHRGQFLVIPSQYEYVNTALISSTSNATYAAIQSGIANLTMALQETFKRNSLSAIIYSQQQNLVVKLGAPSQSGRNGILAAVTGSPVVTVPIGFSDATSTAPQGVPIGMEILGKPWSEKELFGIGRAIERLGRVRRMPKWAGEIVEVGNMVDVPVVMPDSANIPTQYPVGLI
jgi:Asp-tRNA(Asn)/Glu-tRNA(Gln) amidotransferase A subunit family amidase